jgi:uncharacterized protein
MTENLLGRETSPYLLQHKDNPVHWMPWGSAAFERARQEDKPVLLSVGYAACHWCHVMAHESFEDDETAALMNARFINIKVDREERPDVDRIYMQSLHALGEHGGWPLTMFLTPDAEPFWGGTYFPKESRYGRPSFRHVLTEIDRIWRTERDKVRVNSTALSQALKTERVPARGASLSDSALLSAARAFLGAVDLDHGGLKGAPKFPQAPLFSFLWAMAARTADADFARAVEVTLRNICQGGIYDHLGGGIARYSTDAAWLVPHFEKMLYDNAQLVALLSRVWLATRKDLFRTRIEETISFLIRDMRVSSGAFASSYDADSEGEEGKYYVWTEAEIDRLIEEPPLRLFKRTYDVRPGGNWEGNTILNRLEHQEFLSPAEEGPLAAAREALFRARLQRPPPGFDDKVLADWNGLAISALADAALVFGRRDWADAARDAFRAVLDHLWTGDRLRHSWRAGETRHNATADDYANLIAAALALSALFPGQDFLPWAERLCGVMAAYHWDESRSAFCLAASDADVIVRQSYGEDDVTPNANPMMVMNFVRLHHISGKPEYLTRAEAILARFSPEALANPFGYPTLLKAFAFLSNPVQIVVAGPGRDPFSDAPFRVAIDPVGPDCVIQWVPDAASLPPDHPAFAKAAAAEPKVYICRERVCAAPAGTVEEVTAALDLLELSAQPRRRSHQA